MSGLNTAEYYRGREEKERALADAADSPHIAAIHRQMADSYRQLTERSRADEAPLASLEVTPDRQQRG